jgi:plastocyanin
MRRFMPHAVAVVALVLLSAGPASAATSAVQIKSTGFAPATVTINANDSVKWTNTDTKNHQVVANDGSFASEILAPSKSYTHAFGNGGTFRYHDGLHPTLRGTVIVKGVPPQVTLATSAPVVKFGTQVTLTGTVTSKKAGETVTLVALPYGQTTKQVVATLQTTTNGVFSYSLAPQLNTTYQAQWKSRESSVIVQVQPLIKLPFVSRTGYFHFYVTAGQSFAGRFVYLQRFTLAHTWVNVTKLRLGQKSGRIMSVRSVRRLIPRGRWSVRIYMPASEMPGGYIDTWSGTQPVVKR